MTVREFHRQRLQARNNAMQRERYRQRRNTRLRYERWAVYRVM